MQQYYLLACATLVIAQVSVAQECVNYLPQYRIPIALGVFLPGPYVAQLEPSINTALDHIHNYSCILNDYLIAPMFKYTWCKTSLGMKALFELMNAPTRPFALFGDLCTNVNEPVAMTSKYWSIIHLSYAETHAKFATADAQEMYPTFFRIVPGDRGRNEARCRLIFHFNWTRVGTLKQSDDPRYALPHESLTTKLEHGFGVKVVYTAGIAFSEIGNIGHELAELKKRDVRIMVGDFDETLAIRILCEAYERGMYGDNYVWILPSYHQNNWWTNVSGTSCTISQMREALAGHFAIGFSSHSPELDRMAVANMTVGTVLSLLMKSCGNACDEGAFYAYTYDGIWSLALAVHNVALEHHRRTGHMWDPTVDSKYWPYFHSKLLSELKSSSFYGVTGRVQFENNERLGLTVMQYWQNGSYVDVGYFDETNMSFIMNTYLENWSVPLDATVVVTERKYVTSALFVILSLLASVGVSLACVFLSINIRYRHHRFIKMSSPNMNNLIIAGSVCTYVSVILLGIDTRFVSPSDFVAICYVKTWVLCLGFTLAFGSMFSKTWRVHSIFANIRMNKKAIKDSKLFFLVGLIALVDAVVLVLWATISPFSLSVLRLAAIHFDNKVIVPEIERCHSDDSFVFQGLLLGVKGLLLILGCFLAWETRHVNMPALNDSKYIGMSVYNVVVMCTLGVSLAFILQDRVDEAYALTSCFIIFCTTLTLCLVFVPKVIELIRSPQGSEPRYQKGLVKSVIGQETTRSSRRVESATEQEQLQRLEEDNLLWRRFLFEKSNQLWDLMEKLRELGEFGEDFPSYGKEK
ncbi:hypothetical protein AB6A40_000392 [Gnathostoma spinigerum]|uniref:Gamma-aminobutyric acid type B receptor subunit 2 n=1 Tax=Gnathostoma spinigerum TaxID=75299 RepID=A0ABD6E236_9BILA